MVTDIPPVSVGSGSKPLVLVVDDEYGPRESIAFTLSSDFTVETASRATEAIKKLRTKQFAVVVLDIRMPEMDGIKALEEMRKLDQDVAVIMLTGYGTLSTAQQAMVAGANQYLRKPPDVNELVEAVRRQAFATRMRRQQTSIALQTQEMNAALKQEIENAEPHIWQSRASVELVHDLNNPLTVVIGYSALLADEVRQVAKTDGVAGRKLKEYTAIIEKAAEYCHHLSENWRLSSRNQAEFTQVDVVQIAREVRQIIFFENEAIQFSGLEQALVRGSKFELMRIFQNLFKNSLEAGAKVLTMSANLVEGKCVVTVRDNGSGMTPESLRKAMRGGFSSKSSTGLGISICRHLLGAHGATLKIESSQGTGTTVSITFPAIKS